MSTKTMGFNIATGLLLWRVAAHAVDRSFTEALGHIELKSTGSQGEPLVWMVIPLLVLIVAPIIVYYYRQKHPQHPPVSKSKKVRPSIQQQARQLGFKLGEVRVLKQLADRMRGRVELDSPEGRRRFAADIKRRIHRKQRELEMLNALQQRLCSDDSWLVRESVRVETDLPVWLVRKSQQVEEILSERDQEGGVLVDLGESGAALRCELALAKGDVVEWWSTDSQIWIPPLTAVVVGSENGTVHLQFSDPPVSQIRRAIGEIQREGEAVSIE